MLRLIVKTDDASMAVNVGGNVLTTIKTFDVHAPEIETFLRRELHAYEQSQVIGVEVLP